MTIIEQPARDGVLAFGDSITNGGGELQYGVALQSWALWVARGLGLPFSTYAVDGARVAELVADQLPAHAATSAHRDARYELGCLYIGVNDVRAPDWEPVAYEGDLRTALDYLSERCDRVLAVTIPLDLGRPPAGAAVVEANAIIEACAQATGVSVLDLRDFGGRAVLMADHVHPTALGQVEIAERALTVLAADGLPTRVAPRALVNPAIGIRGRLRHELRYVSRLGRQALVRRPRRPREGG